MIQPFAEVAPTDPVDSELVERVRTGSRKDLGLLLERHQAWIYNIARRMLYHHEDAEDATQEILVKVVTRLSTFEARSSFRTWLYRVAVNHLLNLRRDQLRTRSWTFERYAEALDATPDLELPDSSSLPVLEQLIVDEARMSCTSGMLLCLDPMQRLTYILGEILEVPDSVGAELLEITRENFRQKLARARRDLHSFMHGKCGLVNAANPCRCPKKAQGFIRAGYVDPTHLRFLGEHLSRVQERAPDTLKNLESLDVAYGAIYRAHPFYEAPDFAALLRELFSRPEVKSILEQS